MILSVVALSAALLAPQDAKTAHSDAAPVTLSRVFTKGEKLEYSISSNLQVESRQYGLQTFMPSELDLNYKFSTEVKELKNDGVAIVHYTRPNMVQVDGETADRGPKTTVEKVDWNYDLTVSPINEVVEMKDLTPPKKKTPPKKSGGDGDGVLFFVRGAAGQPPQVDLGQFIGEMYRLALNVGSMDSALDFSPKLPLDEVKVGDTWKKTVSYQPQKLKGKDGKQAVQRLDYTFTYKGLVTVNGKQFYRVNAALDLNTDLGAYVNQLLGMKPEESHLKAIPLTLKQSIDYDLDMATKRTVDAHSKAQGGFKISVTDVEEPVQEQKMTGSTEMRLISSGVATPIKPTAKAASGKGGGHHR
jgi:hypothetical protein